MSNENPPTDETEHENERPTVPVPTDEEIRDHAEKIVDDLIKILRDPENDADGGLYIGPATHRKAIARATARIMNDLLLRNGKENSAITIGEDGRISGIGVDPDTAEESLHIPTEELHNAVAGDDPDPDAIVRELEKDIEKSNESVDRLIDNSSGTSNADEHIEHDNVHEAVQAADVDVEEIIRELEEDLEDDGEDGDGDDVQEDDR